MQAKISQIFLDYDVTSWFTLSRRKDITLKKQLYLTGQFARKASVSLRTLRHYDRMGLLSPSQYTESGYRLYSDEDLLILQRILALKFLGVSLEEIKACLRQGPSELGAVLAQQRAMMREKRSRLDAVVEAIEETEALLRTGSWDWESISRVIETIQMEKTTHWVNKYFTNEQRENLDGLIQSSYSDAARANFQSLGEWTEEDQKRADEQWRHVGMEARRLAAIGADPGGDEAQEVARLKSALLSAFTRDDTEVEAGLGRFWESFKTLPNVQRPFDYSPYDPGEEGAALLDKAMAIYERRHGGL